VSKKTLGMWCVASLILGGSVALAAAGKKAAALPGHPELNAGEMLMDCAECHQQATPDINKQWYDSAHGFAMVKCYQCHGTFETFTKTPVLESCAACHAVMLEKCPQDKPCWSCHVPHVFKAK